MFSSMQDFHFAASPVKVSEILFVFRFGRGGSEDSEDLTVILKIDLDLSKLDFSTYHNILC